MKKVLCTLVVVIALFGAVNAPLAESVDATEATIEMEPIDTIIGEPVLTAEQLEAYALTMNPLPLLECTLEELAQLYLEEGEAEGVRGDLAFCQAILGTKSFGFGGQALPAQNNYANIGTANGTGTGHGAWFSSPREGVRAQIQHLKGYATTEPLNLECVDPRYTVLVRNGLLGTAETITQLSGKWSTSENYGQAILAYYIEAYTMANAPVPNEQGNVHYFPISKPIWQTDDSGRSRGMIE